ncbi:MAG TPA: BREX-1 system adenine-specific DNA-methyltransferase PglX [Clostridiaceae bacterium]|nr:BREX-1 system adenine-specific DNA-methyltransferase PglX [Clostridiaceae bacterium]
MNRQVIEQFAIKARTKLIRDITHLARLIGITPATIAEPESFSTPDLQLLDLGTNQYMQLSGQKIKQREALIETLLGRAEKSDYATAFASIIEEVAYTWFNRLIAIRFMEVNDYLPSGIRILSSEDPYKQEPDLVTRPFSANFSFSSEELRRISELQEKNGLDQLFQLLFIKQCNQLHEVLPDLFEPTADYTELLMPLSFTDKNGVVYHLVNDIDEADFNVAKGGRIEIIGWLYQYYNADKRNEIIDVYSKKVIEKDDIPAATQLFTTDWIVRYMVDNSLGRYWLERNPNSKLKDRLSFYVSPTGEEASDIDEIIAPQDLTFFDPCMGSGHILIYAFDVLMAIYCECGYTERAAAQEIVKNNLYGLDIDKRAYQLAYFALMMKVRSYNCRAFNQGIECNLAFFEESNGLTQNEFIQQLLNDRAISHNHKQTLNYLLESFHDAREYGSLIFLEDRDYAGLKYSFFQMKTKYLAIQPVEVIQIERIFSLLERLVGVSQILCHKYAVVCTNPPYLSKYSDRMKRFLKQHYAAYSGDLFSAFIFRNFQFCRSDGFSAFMAPTVWMFIQTYEDLRKYIIEKKGIVTLIQLEYSAYEEATVPICTFVLKNQSSSQPAYCFRLTDFKGGMEEQRDKVLDALCDRDCSYLYEAEPEKFALLPGAPLAYWAGSSVFSAYEKGVLMGEIIEARQGLATTNNNLFLRQWYEVDFADICFSATSPTEAVKSGKKWFPYNKGGKRRQWYGNNDFVVNWEEDGRDIRAYKQRPGGSRSSVPNHSYYFREAITWSLISSSSFSIRYREPGSIFDVAGMSAFSDQSHDLLYALALMGTKLSDHILQMINPTINMQVGDFLRFPVIFMKDPERAICIAKENIELSRLDWNSFETSWDFRGHSLLFTEEFVSSYYTIIGHEPPVAERKTARSMLLKDRYDIYKKICNRLFDRMKQNETELNRMFIELYGFKDELDPSVNDADITVTKIFDRKCEVTDAWIGNPYVQTKKEIVSSFLSYAIGCIFKRYNPRKWSDVTDLSSSGAFVSYDNCLVLTDDMYWTDDVTERFVCFVRYLFGDYTLEVNLDFIADALLSSKRSKKMTSREVIRHYFYTDFYKDHLKVFKRRPIYWLFDSGKENGFKALCYLHRWDDELVGRVRIDYLHKLQKIYNNEIEFLRESVEKSDNNHYIAAAQKRENELQKKLHETRKFDEKMAHLANERIAINLDDGVVVNHEKVQISRDGNKYKILADI